MKLLHVIAGTNPESGGPIEALLRISEVLIRHGHEITVASLEDAKELAGRNYPFPIIALGQGTRPYRFNPQLNSWLSRNANNFDVIVLHGLWNYSSFGSWRTLRNRSTPYYIFAHGMIDPWFRERYPLKHLAKQVYWALAEGRVLRDSQAVLFTCEEEKRRARGVFKGHQYNEAIALLGTAEPEGDPAHQREAFASACPALRNRRFLLFLSRIHPKKGCDLIIEAFASLLREVPEDLDLVIAGPDQVGWLSDLQALANKLGIGSRVHWPGMLKGDVKFGAFRSAWALILASHQENFGFVVVGSHAT